MDVTAALTHAEVERAVASWVRRTDSFHLGMKEASTRPPVN